MIPKMSPAQKYLVIEELTKTIAFMERRATMLDYFHLADTKRFIRPRDACDETMLIVLTVIYNVFGEDDMRHRDDYIEPRFVINPLIQAVLSLQRDERMDLS